MQSSLFRWQAVKQQKNKLYGEVIITQPPSTYRITFVILLIVLAIVLLLLYGTYARRETVVGYVVPDKGLVKIYAPIQGELYKQHITEGQIVKQGELLFSVRTLSANSAGSDKDALLLNELSDQKQNLTNKIEQEQLLNESRTDTIIKQIVGVEKEITESEKGLNLQQKQLSIVNESGKRLLALNAQGHISQTQLSESKQQIISSKLAVQNVKRQVIQLENRLTELSQQQKQQPLEWQSRESDLKRNLSDITQRLVEISGRREYVIRAPVSGRLTALQISEGQRLNTQSLLVAILPKDTQLHVELFLPTRAAGFIAKEQSVLLRFGAFPYQHYGLHKGKISHIAQVILAPNELPIPVQLNEPVYRVKVTLDSQTVLAFGKEFPLQAGMLLDADIILEKRTLGQWLLEPIYGLRGAL